jgi:hypothetical protein
MAVRVKLSKEEQEEKERKRRTKAEKEQVRSQMAFSTILSTMTDIAREEVTNTAIELWRSDLNIFRGRGEKIKMKDFLVNSEDVDPFNAHRYTELAEWFVEQWHRFKPGAKTVHVRGLHYAISALAKTPDAVKLPNGMIYDNTDLRWQDLQRAGKYARYLGLINPEAFEDRRSRQPIVKEFETGWRNLWITGSMEEFSDFELPDFPDFPDFPCFPELPEFPDMPSYYFSLRGQQRYRLEVWIEKSTQDNVIQDVCERHKVTSVTAQGEISISSMWQAITRAGGYGKLTTTVILYISDFDPAGQSMPVAASRKLEFLRLLRHSSVNMQLYPIALTHEQCIEYQLPRTPLKKTDERRHGFEDRYGEGATELDALESLHPGVLASLLEENIRKFHDPTISGRTYDRWREVNSELSSLADEINELHGTDVLEEEYQEVVDALQEIENKHNAYIDTYDECKRTYDEFVETYDDDVRGKFNTWYWDSFVPLRTNLRAKMQDVESDLHERMPDVEEYDVPEAAEVPLGDDCLFDTTRGYVPQLAVYKQFAGKFEHLIDNEDKEDEDELQS